MTQEEWIRKAEELSALYSGKTVVLLDMDPLGLDLYGEAGMKADVVSVTRMQDTEGWFDFKLDFAAHREHNISMEMRVYGGKTATEAGFVEDLVTIGLQEEHLAPYFRLGVPNPVQEAWKAADDGSGYIEWLERTAAAALGIEVESSAFVFAFPG